MVTIKMDIQRFKCLIEAYGTNSAAWPVDEKKAALLILESDHRAKNIFMEFSQLDDVLNTDIVNEPIELKSKILGHISNSKPAISQPSETATFKQLPQANEDGLLTGIKSWLTSFSNDYLNQGSLSIWRPAMAACIPLLAGVYLGTATGSSADDYLLEWEEDIYVMGLVHESEETE